MEEQENRSEAAEAASPAGSTEGTEPAGAAAGGEQGPGARGAGAPRDGDRPSTDARHTAKATIWAAVLSSAVAIIVAVGLSDGDDEEEPKQPQASASASPRQEPGPANGEGGGDADASPASRAWATVWEDRKFRFTPPTYTGGNTLIDFDGSDGPEVVTKDDVDAETELADINYFNQTYGYVQLLPGRQLGLSDGDARDPKECRRVAVSLPLDPGSLGLMDHKRAASPVDEGSVMCMITERGNLVRIEVTALRDPRPQVEEEVFGAYTLEGTATLWRPTA